jgi:hypothetical protein
VQQASRDAAYARQQAQVKCKALKPIGIVQIRLDVVALVAVPACAFFCSMGGMMPLCNHAVVDARAAEFCVRTQRCGTDLRLSLSQTRCP